MSSEAAKAAVVRRILDRYLIEIVERYELCPWARPARLGGELAVGILWGAPGLKAWVAAARELLARPGTRVAIAVAPELAIDRLALRAVRDLVTARIPHAGVAEFHPDAELDLTTPARLVPFLRRAPDPLLQLVPLAVLGPARALPVASRAEQARILVDRGAQPRDVAAQIAAANHATVLAQRAAIAATLDDIARDRAAAYAQAGIR